MVLADRFKVEAAVGAGGMSLVYSAIDLHSGERVALKLMSGDRASMGRFEREIHVLGELDHPAIVRYVSHGELAGGAPFLVMEWLDGEDLGERLRRQPLSIDHALVLAERVALALGAAHKKGVVHRDVKPTNLFLPGGRVEQVKVLDFGVARAAFGADLTQTQTRIGTPAYMSPEQAKGEAVDVRTDVYGLGAIAYAALTGAAPFGGGSAAIVMTRVVRERPRPPSELTELPPALDDVVARAMAKAPAERYATPAELAAAFTRALRAASGE